MKPFGRMVGLGHIIVGISCSLYGVLFWVYDVTQLAWLLWVSLGLLFGGIITGLIIAFYAMIKYNKGIF